MFALAEKCPAFNNTCGGVVVPMEQNFTQEVNFYSEPRFKGENFTLEIPGVFGCSNILPDFKVKSMKSTGSTFMALHYGHDCAGHVIAETGTTNFFSMSSKEGCAKSIFLKLHRKGSC
ncbi:hypothetical protein DSO57_1019743 [Entomophthora muscae]|uniref:Uncharacterized protein n=1 Tax=Entomophthora muscae TaxID=34485 RepID=A0ACC2U1Q6_9FUNG|nr:hypothetical protein DSO57_1019743 [Entomophthora muscae]